MSIQVAAAKQLRSGDLVIYTQTVVEKEALQINLSWAKTFKASKMMVTTYSVIAYGIPVNSIQMNNQKQIIACIQTENYKIENEKDILISYVEWLYVSKCTAGFMMMEFTDAEQVNIALQTGLI